MIIDCHGHYTTAPNALWEWRKRQVAGQDPGPLRMSDDEIRDSLEKNQLRLQRERGTDLTFFSPRAGSMEHHVGDAKMSEAWSRQCNDLIHRVCSLYPARFAPVCQLPQSPGVAPENCIAELERCVKELGFIGCNLNPDPSGGYWTGPPLGDRSWYPLYEKLVELLIGQCREGQHAPQVVGGHVFAFGGVGDPALQLGGHVLQKKPLEERALIDR